MAAESKTLPHGCAESHAITDPHVVSVGQHFAPICVHFATRCVAASFVRKLATL